MKKTHYVIDGYIPSDEDKVEITTYKFQHLGCKDKKYLWIAIDSWHGIGTGTDEYGGEDKEEELLKIMSFIDGSEGNVVKRLYTDNFEDVLEARQKIKEQLQERLKIQIDRKTPSKRELKSTVILQER